MSDSSYKHILKYTSIFGSVQGLSILVGVVRNKVLSLLLGPTGLGLASIYNSTVVLMTEATNLGLPTSAVRSVSDKYENDSQAALVRHIAAVRAWTFMAALLGLVACLLLGPVFSEGSFNYGDHTLNYLLLAPAVSFSIITGGEMAIMKGARRLRSLMWSQIAIMFSGLIIAVPIYWRFNYRGVIPVIVLTALVQAAITLFFSLRKYPLRMPAGMLTLLREGFPMLPLGMAFVLTGIMGKGAEVFIRYYLNNVGALDVAGLYNAGYMLAVSYAGMVFTAMETDYYPRLSACGNDVERQNKLVNRQIEVSMLLVAPMLLALMVSLPIVMQLLFSSKFLPIVPMAQVAVLAMYAKGATLPVAYLPLAKSHSRAFIVLEGLYAIFLCAAIPVGYTHWGLYGTGLAVVAAHLFDLLIVWVFAVRRYHFSVSSICLRHIFIQSAIGLAAYMAVLYCSESTLVYILLCALLMAISAAYSAHTLFKVHRNNQ